ncbi:MAG: choline transporter [Microbacterium sp. 71-36]|uniref:BCCT family transporter n=1 Tax=unclassified Microbacterium TaxID=2609290 RepID=UPI000869EB10|nr:MULTISPECIES: BCCT family transporter [unclassified Microbacterium]MBN9211984.1 BCCT family transporter [Microbacterium sp.]ODT37269.1 MAG: choline transporter [Microbacterium sp. SCN 71-17]OJV74413.1 MAG: choline transporter [Microbacterium sp. 71-36]
MTEATDTEASIDPPADRSPRTLQRWVFWPAAAIALVFIAFALFFPAAAEVTFGAVQTAIVSAFNWYYVLIAAFFVVFALTMGFSRFGRIKLGRDDDEPEFSTLSWFSLLFAAGMGIGLVFYGVSEPLSHFTSPRPGVEGTPTQLAQQAMSQTFLHWGVHAWSIYVVIGLALAYAFHRRQRPRTIRWALEPILGARLVQGGWGNAVDVAALVGTLFGVATSLGLGVIQISAGLEFLGVVSPSILSQAILIGVITTFVLFSVLSGVGRGMKWLSNFNLVLAGVLMLYLLFAGPTEFLLRDAVQSIGNYIQNFVGLSFTTSAYAGDAGVAWQGAWTAFYWGWWISWAPFVGIFIARISRGRTVREFVTGVILVPTLVGILWFTVLGGSAIYAELTDSASFVGPDGTVDVSTALFQMLETVPGSVFLVVGFLLLIGIFFITSADSGALVMSMIATGGEEEPPRWTRVFFTLATSVIAFALLIAGGLTALQAAAISIALPFSLVLLAICWATVVAFRRELKAYDRAERARLRDQIAEHYGLEVEEANRRGIFGLPARWRRHRAEHDAPVG